MTKSRFTEEQIAYALKQAETGTPVADVRRRLRADVLPLEKLYGGLGTGEMRRLRQLEDEKPFTGAHPALRRNSK